MGQEVVTLNERILHTFHVLRTYWKESADVEEKVMDDCNSKPDFVLLQ